MNQLKKILLEVSRVLLGLVFIFSGFVKAIDPLGSAYKYQDYFTAWGLDFLSVFSLPLSFGLSLVEFTLGVLILLAVYRKFSSYLVFLFMLVMTPFTLYLAIANPVSDCGCFGDAWVISNWETFSKNVVLLLASIVLLLYHKQLFKPYSGKIDGLLTFYTSIAILSVSLYCYKNLPMLDFRPYKVGTNLPESMTIPEGMPSDEYISSFIYEKDGKQKEFSLEEAPLNDSTWVFVDAKNTLIKGYVPPISDFSIVTPLGDDITQEVLQHPGYTFLLISHKLAQATETNVDRINDIFDYCQEHQFAFYCLTASSETEIEDWKNNAGAEYPICLTDEITLKTIVRSNPGLLLLKDGVLFNKWHNNNIPADEASIEAALASVAPAKGKQKVLTSLLLFLLPLVLLYFADSKTRKQLKKEQE